VIEMTSAKKEFENVFAILTEEFLTTATSRKLPQNAIEWIKKLQAFFLVSDDIMDASITRRGNPCWYKMEGVGNIAINDALILESAIYFFLKKYFRKDAYYVDLLELFHEDDYLDCFGDPDVIGKIGTDIEDNKCSWCINQALIVASPEQRKLLDKHYGKNNPEDVSIIKQIYKDLNIEGVYREYEENSYVYLTGLISQLDENIIKKDIFLEYMKKIYKRTK
ncbi:13808_t:CDS:2, partial [Racocetra fulgida]